MAVDSDTLRQGAGHLYVRPSMQRVPVEKISIDAKLGLLVTPEHGNYEQIYRAANGLRWNQEHGAICAV